MLDLISGVLTLDSGEAVSPKMPESSFVRMNIGTTAVKGLTSGPHQWYSITPSLLGRKWDMSLGFQGGILRHVSFSPARPNASWNTFSAAEEAKIALELQDLLRAWLPGLESKPRQSMQSYSLPWGIVAAGVVPQDATASISILYDAEETPNSVLAP
jgi:hypothetical protein